MNVNTWNLNEQIQVLIRSRRAVDADQLADPDIPSTNSQHAATRGVAPPGSGGTVTTANSGAGAAGSHTSQGGRLTHLGVVAAPGGESSA
jgi:hypothetical protein